MVNLLRSGRRTLREADGLANRGELDAAIRVLAEANRAQRGPELERRMIALRHRAGADRVAAGAAAGVAAVADPPTSATFEAAGVPEVGPDELTPSLLRSAILQRGCLLVRGLVPRAEAEDLAEQIDHAFEARESGDGDDSDGWYDEFSTPEHPGFVERGFTAETGGMWTVDSPRILFNVIEMFERVGMRDLLTEYLGERPAISVQKGTLRKVSRARVGWHQDGRFLGQVRTMNIWLALSRCGDVAPGLDLIPRRLDEIVPTGTDGVEFDWAVAGSVAERMADEAGIVRPIFEAGDAVLFDDLFLHSTAAEDDMTQPRYAIETWFFAPSAFPSEYVPLLF